MMQGVKGVQKIEGGHDPEKQISRGGGVKGEVVPGPLFFTCIFPKGNQQSRNLLTCFLRKRDS